MEEVMSETHPSDLEFIAHALTNIQRLLERLIKEEKKKHKKE